MIVGTAFTVTVIAAPVPVPQPLATVIVPVYIPAAVDKPTGMDKGLEGNVVPAVTLVRPTGEPVQLKPYVRLKPVDV